MAGRSCRRPRGRRRRVAGGQRRGSYSQPKLRTVTWARTRARRGRTATRPVGAAWGRCASRRRIGVEGPGTQVTPPRRERERDPVQQGTPPSAVHPESVFVLDRSGLRQADHPSPEGTYAFPHQSSGMLAERPELVADPGLKPAIREVEQRPILVLELDVDAIRPTRRACASQVKPCFVHQRGCVYPLASVDVERPYDADGAVIPGDRTGEVAPEPSLIRKLTVG
jgi:hypothetical protein